MGSTRNPNASAKAFILTSVVRGLAAVAAGDFRAMVAVPCGSYALASNSLTMDFSSFNSLTVALILARLNSFHETS